MPRFRIGDCVGVLGSQVSNASLLAESSFVVDDKGMFGWRSALIWVMGLVDTVAG